MKKEGWGEEVRRNMEGGGGKESLQMKEEGRNGNIRKIFGGGKQIDEGIMVRIDMVKKIFMEGIGYDDMKRRMKKLRMKNSIMKNERK